MPIESTVTYICSHCRVRATVSKGKVPASWLRDTDGRQMRQDNREPVPWLLHLGKHAAEDLCPVCAEHFRKKFFPVIDDAGSFLGPVTRVKIRVADLLHALADEWDRQIERWPVEGADFNIDQARDAAKVEKAAVERAAKEKEDAGE